MKEKLNILIFISALVALFVFVVILPADPDAGEYENRTMAEMPLLSFDTLRSGSFFEGMEGYLSDNTAYRTSILQFSADIGQSYGIRAHGGATMVDTSGESLGSGLIPDVDDEDLYLEMPGVPGRETPTLAPGASASNETPVSPGAQAPSDVPTAPGEAPLQPGLASQPPDTGMTPSDGSETDDGRGPHDSNDTTAQAPVESPEPDRGATAGPDERPVPGSPADTTAGTPAGQPSPAGSRVDVSMPFSVDNDYSESVVFYERYREKERSAKRYAEILNSYAKRLPEDVRIFSMIAPIRVEFMGENYAASNDSQLATIEKINDLLDERIIRTATYDRLATHRDEYIYFRTDHHWTALGAYYAYLSFAEAAFIAPVTIDKYIEHSIPGFLGSFAKGTKNKTTLEHPDTLYYYTLDTGVGFSRRLFVIPEDMSKLSYRVFMGGDYAKLDYTSTNTNGKTLVVVKDSYANALLPWLSPSYERIIVIDPRQYTGSVTKLIEGLENVDLLFVDYVAATAMADYIEMINNVK